MSRTELQELLPPGENLGEVLPASKGGNQETYGYRIYPVTGPEDAEGSNAVVLDIDPGGSTELEHTVRPGQVMSVQALRGLGDLVMYRADGVEDIVELVPGAAPVEIPHGVVYQYFNTGSSADEPLTVLDRTRPAWRPDDEVQVEERGELAELQRDDYVVVWYRRRVRGARTAGALRLVVFGRQDTAQYNADHSGQSKFTRATPHAWALAQRVDDPDQAIWPVDVYQQGRWLSILPHAQASDAIIGKSPQFMVQPDARFFQGRI